MKITTMKNATTITAKISVSLILNRLESLRKLRFTVMILKWIFVREIYTIHWQSTIIHDVYAIRILCSQAKILTEISH